MQFHPIANVFPLIEGIEFQQLVEDVRSKGLLEPIWLYERAILDGRNRYRACMEAGVEPHYRTYGGDDPIGFVVSLNLKRRHLNPSQLAMVADRLATLPIGANQHTAIAVPSQATAAELLNVSEDSIQRARKVHEHGAPELIAAVEKGDVAVSAAAALTDLPQAEQAEIVARGEKEILAKAKEIRQGKTQKRREERLEIVIAQAAPIDGIGTFPILLADPPWEYEFAESEARSIENQYPTMTLADLMDLPIKDLTTDDALLFLWTTPPKACEAFCLLQAWGFDYVSQWVWVKDKMGMGYWGRAQHEIVYVCRRGTFPTPSPDTRPSSVFSAPRSDHHSEKPSEVHERIERMFPRVPKIELFARCTRDGWASWGNQITEGIGR